MADHEADDARRFNLIDDALQRIETKLDPVSEAYRTTTTLGKWFMAFGVFLSILLGIVMSFKTIFGK